MIQVDTGSCQYTGAAVSLSAQPKGITAKNDLTFVITMKSILSLKSGSVVDEMNVEYEPSCCAFSPSHNHLVVGEAGGNTVRVYSTQVQLSPTDRVWWGVSRMIDYLFYNSEYLNTAGWITGPGEGDITDRGCAGPQLLP